MIQRLNIIAYLLLVLFASGCRNGALSGFNDSGDFKAVQRLTTEVPNSQGRLTLGLGDISFGMVPIKLTVEGKIVLQMTLREGGVATFSEGGETFRIALLKMNNYLIGADDAIFRIQREGAATAPSQALDSQIRTLIGSLSKLDGAQFRRNGKTHTAAEAERHLLEKYESRRGEIHSVEDFISQVATKSSMSGEPYVIILGDGTETPAADWFRAQAARLGDSSATIPRPER